MFIPKITVKKIDYEYNVSFICELLIPRDKIENTSLPFRERVYGLIPELKSKIKYGMTRDELYHEVDIVLQERLYLKSDEVQNRVVYIQKELDKIYLPLMINLLKLFELEWDESESEIICYLGCCPVFPRDVIKKEFCINYNTVVDKIIRGSIHEINHFILFEKWKSMHGYSSPIEPTHPEPLWFLEEIVVDATLNEKTIQQIAPYPQMAYQQFYEQSINGISIMDIVAKIYSERKSMDEFLDKTYEFICNNIEEIIEKCG